MSIIANFLGSILHYIQEVVGNYGLSIVIFTIIIKMILLPLTIKQTKSTHAMSEISPKVKEIQKKYKNNPEKQNQEITKLYKEAKINPLAGCLPMLIQMPILVGLFWVLKNPIKYGVFPSKEVMEATGLTFLWVKSLTKPDYILAVLSGVSAFFMQKTMTPPDQEKQMKIFMYVMTGMSFYWGFIFPAGLTLYWTLSNLFSVAQYFVITKPLKDRLAREKEGVANGKNN